MSSLGRLFWGDPGRGRVQICHKGAPGRDRSRRKPRNINDSSCAPRLDPGLCGRFGHGPGPDRVRTGARTGSTGPKRPARPICLRVRFSPPLPGPNMAPREDRSGAHPTARPSEPRNHAETDGHTRGGGPNDPPRAPESGPGPGPRSPPTPPRSARATDSDTPRPTNPIRPTQTHPE